MECEKCLSRGAYLKPFTAPLINHFSHTVRGFPTPRSRPALKLLGFRVIYPPTPYQGGLGSSKVGARLERRNLPTTPLSRGLSFNQSRRSTCNKPHSTHKLPKAHSQGSATHFFERCKASGKLIRSFVRSCVRRQALYKKLYKLLYKKLYEKLIRSFIAL